MPGPDVVGPLTCDVFDQVLDELHTAPATVCLSALGWHDIRRHEGYQREQDVERLKRGIVGSYRGMTLYVTRHMPQGLVLFYSSTGSAVVYRSVDRGNPPQVLKTPLGHVFLRRESRQAYAFRLGAPMLSLKGAMEFGPYLPYSSHSVSWWNESVVPNPRCYGSVEGILAHRDAESAHLDSTRA